MDTTHEIVKRAAQKQSIQLGNPRPLGQIALPSYEEGTDSVPEDQIAKVHKGEKIVPADENPDNPELIAKNDSPEMADARKKVENPGAQTTTAQPKQINIPEPSDAERTAIAKDQQDAMGQGTNGIAKLATANVHAQQLGLPRINLGEAPTSTMDSTETQVNPRKIALPSEPKEYHQEVAGGPLQNGATASGYDKSTQRDFAHMELQAKREDLKQQHAAALAEHTPEGAVKADRIQQELDNLNKNNPYGSIGNHPGILGKIGHYAAKVGNIAGDVLAPSTMELIPGTDLNNRIQKIRLQEDTERDQQRATEQEQAETARKKELRESLPKEVTDKYELKEVTDSDPNSPTYGKNIIVGVNKTDSKDVVRTGQLAATPADKPIPESEKHKAKAESIVGTLATKGYDVSPKSLNKSLAAARKKGDISAEDYAAFKGYQAVNPNAATNLNVSVAGAEAKDQIRRADQYYAYTDADDHIQLVTGDKVPKDAEGVIPIKDVKGYVNGAENTNIVRTAFDDLQNSNLKLFDDPRARAVLDTALDENHADHVGLLVAGTGGQLTLPAGSGKLIDQFLENNAVPKNLREDVKDYIVNYYAAKDKLIALQMSLQNDKMGRSAAPMVNAMMNQLPGAGTNGERMARNSIGKLQGFLDSVQDRYPEQYGNYKKQHSSASSTSRTSGTEGVPSNASHIYRDPKTNQVVGYALDGTYHALGRK